MRKLLKQPCFLHTSFFGQFSKVNSFKQSYLRELAMVILFCFGGDAGFDFAEKNNAGVKAAAAFHSGCILKSDEKLFKTLVTSSTDYFRSRQNGNWSSVSSWESSPDNISWQIATEEPTMDANTIIIQSGHIISVNNPVSLDQTIIAGTLELQTGGVLNINDGVGDDITISGNGILKVISTAPYGTAVNQFANANINIATGGKITIGNGTTLMGVGYENFVTSIINKWNDGAIYEWNNNSIFVTAVTATGLIYFPNASSTEIPIFRITKVGGTINSSKDFLLNGIIEVNTNVTFSGGGKKTFRNGIRGTSTLLQTTPGMGKFYLTAPNAILDGTSLKIVLLQPIDMSPSTFVPVGANVTVSGSNINNNNIPSNVFTVNGTLDVTSNGVANANGLVIINGTYRTAHSGGFSGGSSSIVSGGITLNPGSTIELYASGNQSLNTRTDFKNLIFSGSGIKTPSGNFIPSGTVIIKDDAIFDCTGKNIGDGTSAGPTATNLTMTGNSRLIVSTYGPNPMMAGIYNLTSGVVEFKGANLTPQNIRNKSYQNIEVSGSNVGNSDGVITLNPSGTFIVKNGGIFTINDNTIAGPEGIQTVTVESGGTFRSGNIKGFHGFPITYVPLASSSINSDIENVILQPNSTVEYSRSKPPLVDGDQLITNANGLIYQNLILSGSGNKTAPTDNLIIQGDLIKKGTAVFIHNNGTVILNGISTQNYNSTSPQMVFNNLINNNTTVLNINDSLAVYKKLSLGNNSKINLNADITFQSNKNNTANISLIPTTTAINYASGRFIVERYINTGTTIGYHPKSWQFLSTPAFGETIHNTWQEKRNNGITNYGTWITDPSGIINGFDATSYSPSMKYYNESTNDWNGISNTNINLENEKGYMIFVRGDRSANNLNSPTTPATLRTRGKLYSPEFMPPVNNVAAGKFQSIGNPYASAIDFTKINLSSNIENSFTVWDPTLGGNYGLGGYQTISAATFFTAVPGGTSVYDNTSDYRNIQSGQAFFVHNYAADDGSVSFSELSKTDGSHLVNRVQSDINGRQFLFANLYTSNGMNADGNAVAFDNVFSNKIDRDDALKINNSGENFGIKRQGKILAVEARQSLVGADTIFYNLQNLSKQEYKLMFVPQNIKNGVEAFLIDGYLKTEKPVSLSDTTSVDFEITNDVASGVPNRFMIVFKPSAASMPVSFISVNAYEQNSNIFLEWKVENEVGFNKYIVEFSSDGVLFSNIAAVESNSNSKGIYSYTDNHPADGYCFYRIYLLGEDGKQVRSQVVKVFIEKLRPQISVYPNPLEGENIKVQFIDQPAGKYYMRMLNSSGQILLSKKINHSGGNSNQTFQLNTNIASGIYQLEIIKPGDEKMVIKVRK